VPLWASSSEPLCDARPVPILQLAAQSSPVAPLVAALGFGLVVGVFGHLIQSRVLIVTGILIIGGVSAYFTFVLQPSGG
jgi:hypothetical protein